MFRTDTKASDRARSAQGSQNDHWKMKGDLTKAPIKPGSSCYNPATRQSCLQQGWHESISEDLQPTQEHQSKAKLLQWGSDCLGWGQGRFAMWLTQVPSGQVSNLLGGEWWWWKEADDFKRYWRKPEDVLWTRAKTQPSAVQDSGVFRQYRRKHQSGRSAPEASGRQTTHPKRPSYTLIWPANISAQLHLHLTYKTEVPENAFAISKNPLKGPTSSNTKDVSKLQTGSQEAFKWSEEAASCDICATSHDHPHTPAAHSIPLRSV